MNLSRKELKKINIPTVELPNEAIFSLPEKVLQFGTGVLLRALPDYFIDKANKQGVFNGRIVVVKSTSQGDANAFDEQDGLYTVCVRGIENGRKVEENIVNAAVSRVLSANEQWKEILACARRKEMQVVISNTTEVGLRLVNETISEGTPSSFPGKLLAFLYERFQFFNGNKECGMIVIPTELVSDNGKVLKSILIELARFNQLDEQFIEWLQSANHFSSSLVDRIVPGKPAQPVLDEIENETGYTDKLLLMAEVYRLWAIEGDEYVKTVLSFYKADTGVIIEPDITIYKELKLRLLNATHTLTCGLAFIAGFETVKEGMDDAALSSFVKKLMLEEIAHAIPYSVPLNVANDFGNKVLDRFRNPHIRHQWISITIQYSSKLKMRVVPVLLKHSEKNNSVPQLIAFGFAAYIFFTKPVKESGGKYYGELNGKEYIIQDEQAASFMKLWKELKPAVLVKTILSDISLWGYDLTVLPGFSDSVIRNLDAIIQQGAKKTLQQIIK